MTQSTEPERDEEAEAILDRFMNRADSESLSSDLLLRPAQFGLGQLPARLQPDATTTMVCGYCSTGCGLNIHLRQGRAINLTPASDYPVNLGMACPKGWEALSVLDSPERATIPLRRDRRGHLRPVSWSTATETFCRRMQAIQEQHGPESVAFLGTGQLTTEELALLGCVAKFGMGMVHGDGNTRQCMASAAVAYKQSFGFDAPPYTYADFEQSDVIVLVGSNLCIAHPIMWQRICRNPHRPHLVVVDPRRTETAMAATMHLPLRPKSDLTLFYGIARLLIENDWVDHTFIQEHTDGFAEFRQHVASYSLQHVAEATGLSVETIEQFARLIHRGQRVSFWWTMGVNQSYQGVRTAQSLINLALLTGNIGRPGTGANSITGQCNAMGSRLFSNTTNLLGGHAFENRQHRSKIAEILRLPVERIPARTGWAYHEILENILRGRIRGLWVICTNTAHSWINQRDCHDILDRLDFLVVQDMYATTETAQRADLILPAAGWGEKEGTFINSERRIGLVKKVAPAPGQALADFAIFRLLAHAWGCGPQLGRWPRPEAMFQTLKAISRGQPCDITGIRDYQMIDQHGGIQWPYPARRSGAEEARERRLFADGRFFTASGRAALLFEAPRPMPEPPSPRFPYLLLTGRGSVTQWHTQTRTRNSAVLQSLSPGDPYVEINVHDARREQIEPGQWVVVESQRGRVRAKAFVTYGVQPGQVFMPMHDRNTNQLTHAHFDPYSKQPSYKDCAVRLRPADPWDAAG